MFIQKWILKNILGKNKSLNNPKILSDALFIESKRENEDLTIIKYEKIADLASIILTDYINSNKVQNTNKIINDVPQTKEITMIEDEILVNNLCSNINPEDFEHIKVLGKGFFGKVTQVKYKKNGNIYAMKTLRKEKLKQAKQIEHTKTEKKVLEIVDHPFIVSLKYAFQTPKKLYLIMEYYSGGELFYLLKHCGRFNEKEAKFYFAQIVLVMEFLHSKKIVYRDLKPENIVIAETGYVKLTDFGLAKDNVEEDFGATQTFCGTSEYISPEALRGEKYGKGIDIWCLGIFLYELLFGYPPFNDSSKEKLYKKILFSEPEMDKYNSTHLSIEVKDLIKKLLNKNFKERIKISQVKQHPFFSDVNWNDLLSMKIIPPYRPNNKTEYKFFDPSVVKEKPEDSFNEGISINNKDFHGFTYKKSFN